MTDTTERYWLRDSGQPWREATRDEYIQAEHNMGFFSKNGGEGIATASFSSSRGTEGKTTHGKITEEKHGWDREFLAVAMAPSLASQSTS